MQPIVLNNPFGVDVPLTEKQGGWFAQEGTGICSRVKYAGNDADLFLKIFFWCFFHISSIANHLPGFPMNRLANAEDCF